jgi:hypothetical protein
MYFKYLPHPCGDAETSLTKHIRPACQLAPPSRNHPSLYMLWDESRWACLWIPNSGFHSCVRAMPHGWHMFNLCPAEASRTLLPPSISPAFTHLVFAYVPLPHDCRETAVCSCLLLQIQVQWKLCIREETWGESQGLFPSPAAQSYKSAIERSSKGRASVDIPLPTHPTSRATGLSWEQQSLVPC